MKKAFISACLAAILAGNVATPSQAADKPADAGGEGVEAVRATVLNLIRALVDQGVISAAKAQDMLRQAGIDPSVLNAPQVTQAVPSPEAPKPEVRVPYIPQTVKDEIREELRQDIAAQARAEGWGQPGVLPDWITRFTLFGDMRVRYEREQFASDNDLPQLVDAWYQLTPGTTKDTQISHQQELIRARLGFNMQMGENWGAQMRVVAVNGDTLTASPVSYNVDEASYGRPFSAGIDLANIEWRPNAFSRLTLGRMERPYLATDLVYANDLSFDGVVGQTAPRLSDSWTGVFTAGFHPLTSNWVGPYNNAPNVSLVAAQLGANWRGQDESRLQMAAAYYDFINLQGQLNPNVPGSSIAAASAPPFQTLGNTMFNTNWYSNPNGAPVYAFASKFRLADANVQYDLARFDPLHATLAGEWVRNLGFNAAEIAQRIQGAVAGLPVDQNGQTGLSNPRVSGYRLGVVLGQSDMHRLGAWDVFAGYRYLERDAVPDGFTSLDYRLGGTDQRATILGGDLGLSRRVSLRLFVTSARQIDAPVRYGLDTWFLDLYGSF
jgi:hypothetical protein